ncbi:hypothetical protein [Streptomyces bacillaris]|uniref:hypothetical protein n=1 Tax=Streptomyces bacillaris TaxID=68179 RepID=UPI003647B494
MDPADLEGVFPQGELCRISLESGDVEANTQYMRFTPSALILRGVWHVIVREGDTEDTVPWIGARVIPWRDVRGIESGTHPSNYSKADAEGYMEEYGVDPDERPVYAAEARR